MNMEGSNMVEMEEPLVVYPGFRLYRDGRINRLRGEDFIPPSPEVKTEVRSKDVVLSPETGVSARIFLPPTSDHARKFPVVFYIHGGAFCIETPFSARYQNHTLAIAAEADVIVVSVHYRRAPEHPLPAMYEDAWEALNWVGAHSGGSGPEAWLNDHGDLGQVFIGGNSSGATLAQFVARQAGVEGGPSGMSIVGLFLSHPFFLNEEANELVEFIYPTMPGWDDPRLNPGLDPELGRLGCGRVLIFVAEKDDLKERGLSYYEALKKSSWKGEVELIEVEGEGHSFHVNKPNTDNARALLNKLVSFLKR